MPDKYFRKDASVTKGLIYSSALLFLISVSLVAFIEPFVSLPCTDIISHLKHKNPDYVLGSCRHTRHALLLFMNPYECDLNRRLLIALFLGSIIGFERRQADRPAGVRTMSLVALGSALFTISSSYAFESGPMAWDAARVSAAIPSGVGFLGAGLIFQQGQKDEQGQEHHFVVGITTAASLWLSAAVGLACGGKLYFVAAFTTCLMILLLRFGPRGLDDEGLPHKRRAMIHAEQEHDDDEHDNNVHNEASDAFPDAEESTPLKSVLSRRARQRSPPTLSTAL